MKILVNYSGILCDFELVFAENGLTNRVSSSFMPSLLGNYIGIMSLVRQGVNGSIKGFLRC